MELCNNEFAVESIDNYIEYTKLERNFYFAKFDESLAPLHILAVQGKLSVFKYIFDISKPKSQKVLMDIHHYIGLPSMVI